MKQYDRFDKRFRHFLYAILVLTLALTFLFCLCVGSKTTARVNVRASLSFSSCNFVTCFFELRGPK